MVQLVMLLVTYVTQHFHYLKDGTNGKYIHFIHKLLFRRRATDSH